MGELESRQFIYTFYVSQYKFITVPPKILQRIFYFIVLLFWLKHLFNIQIHLFNKIYIINSLRKPVLHRGKGF